MKLEQLTKTERKIFKALADGNTYAAGEISESSKVDYGYTRVVLNYFKRVGLVKHEGGAHHGEWRLSDLGKKLLKDGNDGRDWI